MKADLKEEPRIFTVGSSHKITLKDFGQIYLEPNEQVTFLTEDKAEYDICKKEWGFYATPSVNGRLTNFGFETVLVESPHGLRYVWLVEKCKANLFHSYLEKENHRVISWLSHKKESCLCNSHDLSHIYTYQTPPLGEMAYDLQGKPYHRTLSRCNTCGHLLLEHNYDMEAIYTGHYVGATYGEKLKKTFEKIVALDPEKSDNTHRVKRIIDFFSKHSESTKKTRVLDVGSGLCVFLYLLKKMTDWDCTALDPDPVQVNHARTIAGIPTLELNYYDYQGTNKFDLITFNKVLEHVRDPIAMLKKSKDNLAERGIVYVELPDGEAAVNDSPLREEFFIEHYHAFSMASMGILAERAGFKPQVIERVREPSGKYTLRMFCS